MTELNSLQAQLTRIFQDKLSLVVQSVETDLFATGGLDSLSFVELLVQLEREFGLRVSFADIELDNFRSIAKIAEFIADHRDPKVTEIGTRATLHADHERPLKQRTPGHG